MTTTWEYQSLQYRHQKHAKFSASLSFPLSARATMRIQHFTKQFAAYCIYLVLPREIEKALIHVTTLFGRESVYSIFHCANPSQLSKTRQIGPISLISLPNQTLRVFLAPPGGMACPLSEFLSHVVLVRILYMKSNCEKYKVWHRFLWL